MKEAKILTVQKTVHVRVQCPECERTISMDFTEGHKLHNAGQGFVMQCYNHECNEEFKVPYE
jgi:hypothetical protein